MRVVVTGGRDFTDKDFIWSQLSHVHQKTPITLLIQGDARGVDRICRDWAIRHDVPTQDCPADWDNLGRRAGHVRNQSMIDNYQPELGVVFPGGKGTADMVGKLRKANIRIFAPVYKTLWDEGAIFEDRFSNIFCGGHDAIVNTVNTVGVMGAGIAKEVKLTYPEVFAQYKDACLRSEVVIGRVLAIRANDGTWILNIPTKKHWKQPSNPEWVRAGLIDLSSIISKLEVKNIGMPFPGCGHGKLKRYDIRPYIYGALWNHPKTRISLYQPRLV